MRSNYPVAAQLPFRKPGRKYLILRSDFSQMAVAQNDQIVMRLLRSLLTYSASGTEVRVA